MNLIIATRKSKLAQAQTELVMSMIKENFGFESEKLLVVTEGDKRLDVTLDKIGGKGLFVKEIEIALMERKAHCAVHSMKDVPFFLEHCFEIAAMPSREDVRDAFVSMNGLSFFDLPKGARIGTSSIRRSAQLKSLRKDIDIVPIRGNVQTRIEKIEKENLDGIILAAAGLKRMGMEGIITNYFNPSDFIPAVGQGALGIEILKDNEEGQILRGIDNIDVRHCVEAERSFMRALNGGCHSPIGAYGELHGDDIYLIGTFQIGDKLVKKDITGNREDRIKLGETLAQKVLKK
ncbi:porphobilinogen deaminase [Clostridium polyendosporum]|uniref:Porphobilinogen deaminase n=1 Tax=Clostridium polyendosporum TaxID=69208 RepID=A0A919RXC8_9CLOT|nr:hydroxymethylbilane synthase [Clostridium polyendosporum]GIM27514.1 porphobilinogen deaminase [Clostridium polyendosporum]